MKRTITIILTAGFVFLFACEKKPQQAISGQTIGLTDNTVIFLSDRLKDLIIDSTQISNSKFSFNIKSVEIPYQVIIHTKDNKKRKTFWLDKSDLTFTQNSSDFKDVTILGSETERIYQDHRKSKSGLSMKKRLEKDLEFINSNTTSILSASLLSASATMWGKDKTLQMFNSFSDDVRDSYYGTKVRRYLDLTKDPKIGDMYTDLTIPDTTGKEIRLSECHSKITLIEFWASWCGPCREENPELIKTYEKYHSKGFEIYAISLDMDKQWWMDAINEDGLEWIHVSDLKGNNSDVNLVYGVNPIPDNFLINEEGKIIGRNLRGLDLNAKLAEVMND